MIAVLVKAYLALWHYNTAAVYTHILTIHTKQLSTSALCGYYDQLTRCCSTSALYGYCDQLTRCCSSDCKSIHNERIAKPYTCIT